MLVTQLYESLNSYESLTTVTRHFVSQYWQQMTHLHTTARALNEHVGSTFREWLLYISASRVQFVICLIVFQFKPSDCFNQYRLREGTGLHLATSRIKLKLNTSWGKTVIFSDWSDSSVKIIYDLYFRSKVKRLWLFVWSFPLASVLLHYRSVTSRGRRSQASSLRTSLVDKEDVFICGGSAGLHQQTQLSFFFFW